MDEETRRRIMIAQAEGMRAMSNEEMARRQLEAADGMRQRGPLTISEQEAMSNFWGGTADELNNFVPVQPKQTLWQRLKSWIL